MTNILGIDHPLVCVHDLPNMRDTYGRLGFNMKGIGKHPWGTSTCAIVFEKSLLELMSVYDTSLIDGYPAGDFRFGRFIFDALREREGIALTALYSDDAERDARAVEARGGVCQGTIEFGRDIVLADGRPDRTSTTLKIFRSDSLPRLSNFACQQHKRHLIERPEWMDHANTAYGLRSVGILAEQDQHDDVLARLTTIHGRDSIVGGAAGCKRVTTGNGDFLVMDRDYASRHYGKLPRSLASFDAPFEFSIDIKVKSIEALKTSLAGSGLKQALVDDRVVLSQADRLGGVILSFVEA